MRPPLGSRVLERAQELVDRRRLLIGLGVAVAIAVIAAIPGLFTSAGGGRSVRTAEFAPVAPTTTAPEAGFVSPVALPPAAQAPGAPGPTTTSTRPALVLGRSITRAPTTTTPKPAPKPAPPAPAAPGASPTTTAPCRNSYDPACGPFSWDPPPDPNQPITGTVNGPQTAKAGEKVTFTVNGTDPDAAPLQECNVDFGDGTAVHCDPRPAIDPSYCPKQYGPWTPPAKKEGTLKNSPWEHTFTAPGNYQVSFDIRSAMQECNNPYASVANAQTTIVVT